MAPPRLATAIVLACALLYATVWVEAACIAPTAGYDFKFPRDEAPHVETTLEWQYYCGALTVESGTTFGVLVTVTRDAPYEICAPFFLDSALIVDFMLVNTSGTGASKAVASYEAAWVAAGDGGVGVNATDPSAVSWNVWAGGPQWRTEVNGTADGRTLLTAAAKASATSGGLEVGTPMGLSLALTPELPVPVLAADNGWDNASVGVGGMEHLARPRLRAEGTIALSGVNETVVSGSLWLQHMWGTPINGTSWPVVHDRDALLRAAGLSRSSVEAKARETVERGGKWPPPPPFKPVWHWFAVVLNDGTSFECVLMYEPVLPHTCWGSVADPKGKSSFAADLTIESASSPWRDAATNTTFNTRHQITSREHGIDVTMQTLARDNFVAGWLIPYYEGASTVEGTLNGKPIRGHGVTERVMSYVPSAEQPE